MGGWERERAGGGVSDHRVSTWTRRAAAVASAVLVAAVAGCSSGSSSSSPTTIATSTTTSEPPPATEPTLATSTSSPIVTVPGSERTTTTLATGFGPGGAQISGRVVGPSGPVDGARVRVERAVGGTVSAQDLMTGPGGSFSLPSILGGRYQLRAWKAPDLAQPEAEAFFLAANEARDIELRVERFGSLNVQVTADGDPLPAGEPFNVSVLVYSASISAAGELLASPIPGPQVIITTGERLAHVGSDRSIADARGVATFRMQCLSGGGTTGEVFVSGGRFPLGLPPCSGSPPG